MEGLAEVAAELYGLPLGEFTAARDARAKELRADGERALATAVRALRRPSTAAWAVNQLVRARPAEVEQLLELGAALRDAQASFAGDELRELGKQQHRVVAALRREAQGVATKHGQQLSEAVAREVEATLKAGMADVDAAAAVRSGLLLRALENTGFTSVDLDGAVALSEAIPAHGGRPQLRVVRDDEVEAEPARDTEPDGDDEQAEEKRRQEEEQAEEQRRREDARRRDEEQAEARRRREEERRRAREEAELALEAAEGRRAEAEDAFEGARQTVDELTAERTGLRERLAELRRRLEEAERADDDVSARLADARSARDDAETTLRSASRAADRARTRLADLDQG